MHRLLFRPAGPAIGCQCRAGLHSAAVYFLCWHRNLQMRIGPAGAHQYYTNSGAPGWTHKILTDIRPMLPLFTGNKMSQTSAKISTPIDFGPPFFELRRFTGNPKQTCQGPMIGLLSYHTWDRSVPQLWDPLEQWVPQRVKVENFLYILRSSSPRRVQRH